MNDDRDEEVELNFELNKEELQLIRREAEQKGVTIETVIRDLILYQAQKDDLDRAMKAFRVSMTTIMRHKNGSIASSAETACQELSRAINQCCTINFVTPIDATRNLQIEQRKFIASVEMAFYLALIDARKGRSENNEN